MRLSTALVAVRRKLRRLLGKGWNLVDFQSRYAAGTRDAWGYAESPHHTTRFAMIMDAIPNGQFSSVLEAGCAEGDLTKRLAERAVQVMACDLSPTAIARAKDNCRDFQNITFSVGDIRTSPLSDDFDLCIMSDVLYYMTSQEIAQLLKRLSTRIRLRGWLLFANEWKPDYQDLTAPEVILEELRADTRWTLSSCRQFEGANGSTLTIALFQFTSGNYENTHG